MIEYSQSISESSGTSLLLIGLRNIALVLLSALDKDGLHLVGYIVASSEFVVAY